MATVVDAAKFFRAHLDGTGSSVNCPQRRTSCHEHLLNFFSPHAATGSRVLIPPLPICSAPQFLPSILPQLFSTSKAPTLAFTVGCCLLSATVPLCRFPFFSIFEAPRAIPFASGCCAAQRRRLACVQKLPKISTQKSMPITPGISTRSSIKVLVRKARLAFGFGNKPIGWRLVY